MPITKTPPNRENSEDALFGQAAAEPIPALINADMEAGIPLPGEAGLRRNLLIRMGKAVGVDRAIAFTVMARGWSSLAGVGTLTLIARFLSPAEQGFYYTFYSLVAMQIVFELGFSVVILQTASHEAAHLQIAADGSISGPEREHTRLASVLQKAVRWYSIAAVLMALLLIPIGIGFLRHAANKFPAERVHFVLPWILVVAASSLTFQLDPLFSFLEGCGFVPEVARTRLRQSLLSTVLGWSMFLFHRGLFAPGCFILGQALAGGWFIYRKRHLLGPLMRRATERFRIDWGTEVWPFQWRIAVSWLAGYLATQLFVPTLMNARGPVQAGQMGMSLTVCATLTTLSVSWMNTKAAPFGRLIARSEYGELDRTFFRTLVQSTAAATLACALVFAAVAVLNDHGLRLKGVPLASRLLPPLPLALLFAGTIGNVIVIGEALYIRAHKQEKFMVNSILAAVYSLPVAYFIGRNPGPHGGAWGIAAAYAFGTATLGLGYGTYTFLKWRRVWHHA